MCPVLVAAFNPLQLSRNPAYIIGSMSGIVALALLLVLPLLVAGYLPGTHPAHERRWHRWLGCTLVFAIFLHIGGLYVTSPDDMTDALLLAAPTPFSVYGVMGLWAMVLTAFLVAARKRIGLSQLWWAVIHNCIAIIVVIASVVHTLMIEGTMGNISKIILCVCILAVTITAIFHLRVVRPMLKGR